MRSFSLTLLAVLLLAAPAAAQSGDDVARARQLFQAGLEAARGERWAEARDAFSESLSLAERPSTLLNLAGAQIATGQLVEGAASYRRFLEIATDAREAAHRADATSALAGVESRIPHVTVRIDGLTDADEVRLDGHVLMPATLGTQLPLDPGAHDVTVTREGRSISSQHFQLPEGLATEIELSVTAPTTTTVVQVVQAEPPPPMDQAIAMPVHDEPQGDDSTVWIVVGVSAGVAVAIGVIVAVVLATQDTSAPAPYQGNLGPGVIRF